MEIHKKLESICCQIGCVFEKQFKCAPSTHTQTHFRFAICAGFPLNSKFRFPKTHLCSTLVISDRHLIERASPICTIKSKSRQSQLAQLGLGLTTLFSSSLRPHYLTTDNSVVGCCWAGAGAKQTQHPLPLCLQIYFKYFLLFSGADKVNFSFFAKQKRRKQANQIGSSKCKFVQCAQSTIAPASALLFLRLHLFMRWQWTINIERPQLRNENKKDRGEKCKKEKSSRKHKRKGSNKKKRANKNWKWRIFQLNCLSGSVHSRPLPIFLSPFLSGHQVSHSVCRCNGKTSSNIYNIKNTKVN